MKQLNNILNYVSRLAQMKSHDPEIYEKLVNHLVMFGFIGGSLFTLWITMLIILLK